MNGWYWGYRIMRDAFRPSYSRPRRDTYRGGPGWFGILFMISVAVMIMLWWHPWD